MTRKLLFGLQFSSITHLESSLSYRKKSKHRLRLQYWTIILCCREREDSFGLCRSSLRFCSGGEFTVFTPWESASHITRDVVFTRLNRFLAILLNRHLIEGNLPRRIPLKIKPLRLLKLGIPIIEGYPYLFKISQEKEACLLQVI